MAKGLFPGKSHKSRIAAQCKGSVFKKNLRLAVLWRDEPEGDRPVGGSPTLPSGICGGGAGYYTNAYLNEYFAFICIHLEIKWYEN